MIWRVYLAIGGLAAAAAGLGYWSLSVESRIRRGELWAEHETEAATLAALRKPVDLKREQTTLRDFARQVSEATGVEVVLDEDRLNEVTVWSIYNELGAIARKDIPLRLPRATLPAHSALSLVLRQLSLEYVVRGRQVVITTADSTGGPLSLAVYPLPQPGMADKRGDANAWAEAVTSLIEPRSWDSVGGQGHCEAVPGALLVAQTPRLQHRVRLLLEGLGQLESPPASWQPVPLSPAGPAWQESLAWLARPAQIDCRKMPLIDLIEYLADECQAPLVLNIQRLHESGIDCRAPITRKLPGISLQCVLESVLSELGLDFVVNEGVIEITTPDDAQDRLCTVAFPVHDLIDVCGEQDETPLIDLITEAVEPHGWDSVGGPAHCGPLIGGWLVIDQTREVLVQIEQLLDQLRKGLYETDTPLVLTAQPAVKRIAAALELELPLEYDRITLGAMCQDLSRRLGIGMELDYRPLADQQINITAPVTFRYEAAPLRVNLQRLCDALGMAWAIREGTLLLTTPDAAEDGRCLRVYDVRPIVDPDLGLGDPDWLIDLVTAHVVPQSWDDVGGPGSLCFFRGLLVVSQSGEIQHQTAGLLAALDQVAGSGAPTAWVGLPSAAIEASIASDGIRSMPTTSDPGDEALRARLQQPVTADFDQVRLVEALARLARPAGVPLRIDRQGLREEGIEADLPITLHARDWPLATALDRLLPRRISYLVERRELAITTQDRRDQQRLTRLFDVRELTMAHGGDDWLQDLLTAHVQPQSWDQVGGNGSITCHRGLLVVTQTPDILREVEALLSVVGILRRPSSARERRFANDGTPTRFAGAPVPTTMTDEFAFQSLSGLVQLDCWELPLGEALAQVSRIAGVPIWLDPRGLADGGVPSDWPVTLTADGLTLAGALDRLLPGELGYYLQGGELIVTSAELANTHLTTRLYRLAAAANVRDDITERAAIEGLPQGDWRDYGGPGEITAIGKEWLLITAKILRHGQIDDWLIARQTGKPPLRARERQALEKERAALDPFAEPAMP